jgi:DNA-binding NarL/FixJ family response regulator
VTWDISLADSTIRVLIVDDFEPWRGFVRSTLQQRPKVRVIGEASDGLEAVEKAQSLQPDLILLDIGLPGLNGIEAARRIREHAPKALILYLSTLNSLDVLEVALSLGRCGYVLKSNAVGELLVAVDALLEGRWFVGAGLAHHDSASHGTPENVRRRHQVQFYSGDSAFVDSFVLSAEAALRNGKVMVVIASDSHHSDIRGRLKADGVNVENVTEHRFYVPLELPDSLSAFDVSQEGMTGDGYGAVEAIRAAAEKGIGVTVG